MIISAANAKLQQVPVDKIVRNPENPRIVFRPEELADLLESIRIYGVQVPISVYKAGSHYVLIDGERRWRCASKLNFGAIPALVQAKPSELENLLLMFNIHALREQWDLLTIALKLPKIIELLNAKNKRKPTSKQLAEHTGLNRGLIDRCRLLMNLPQKYKDQILEELKKPKSLQQFTEDLFIEMERALTTVERAMPEAMGNNRDRVRQVLLKKYETGVIKNIVQFRQIAKIARSEKVDIPRAVALGELRQLFQQNDVSIEAAYARSVGEAYKDRDIGTRVDGLLNLLSDIDVDTLEPDVREKLLRLFDRVRSILDLE